MLCQRIRDSAFIGHDYHAATRAEFHSSRLAQIERWTEVGHRDSAWDAVCRIETRDRRAWGRDDYRSRRRDGAEVVGDERVTPARSGRFSYTNRITCAN